MVIHMEIVLQVGWKIPYFSQPGYSRSSFWCNSDTLDMQNPKLWANAMVLSSELGRMMPTYVQRPWKGIWGCFSPFQGKCLVFWSCVWDRCIGNTALAHNTWTKVLESLGIATGIFSSHRGWEKAERETSGTSVSSLIHKALSMWLWQKLHFSQSHQITILPFFFKPI